jgi:CARDB protein
MRRVAAVLLVPVALGVAVADATAAQTARPALSAKLTVCSTGPTGPDRAAEFTASMPAIDGTRQMAMRFTLLERRAGGRRNQGFHPVVVPKLGAWQRSRRDPRLPGFIVTKRVDGLAAPGAYHAVVRFRWYDAAGRVIRRAHRVTAACRQPDPRPDLIVARLRVSRGPDAEHVQYVVDVHNRGRGDAAVPFATVLTIDGIDQPAQTLATLGGGGRGTISFVAARCSPGSSVRVAVDVTGAIEEVNESNNVVVRPCPAGAGRAAATLARR